MGWLAGWLATLATILTDTLADSLPAAVIYLHDMDVALALERYLPCQHLIHDHRKREHVALFGKLFGARGVDW